MSLDTIDDEAGHLPTPLGPYSSAVRCSAERELLFVSGQLPVDASGNIQGEDLGSQTQTALSNALSVARASGADLEHVVKITLYTTDLSQMDAINHVYSEVLGTARPARTTVEVSRLPRGALIEVDLIAAVAPVIG